MYLRTNEGLGEGVVKDRHARWSATPLPTESPMHLLLEGSPAPATVPPPSPARQNPMARVENALVSPYRCICRIVARAYDKPENEYSIGSGFLISPYHVLTCAHVIYPLEAPHTENIDVHPAQNGPDDNAVRFRANGWAVSPGWRPNDCRMAGEDYGIIRLASPAPYGFFQLRPFDPAIVTSKTVHLAGYPSSAREPKARYMYRSTGPAIGAVVVEGCGTDTRGKPTLRFHIVPSVLSSTSLIAHEMTTAESVSGSPIWIEEGGSRTLIGLHERSTVDQYGRVHRAAVLLNDAVRAQVARWMKTGLPPLRR
jgi:V8-like Glu-specific endopeptidase